MECRPGCGACCIAPSISSAIPGMPQGKPAGVRCIQLDDDNGCRLWRSAQRPQVCGSFPPSAETCGTEREAALRYLALLEAATCSRD